MRYVKQFGIILAVTFLGEIMKNVIPLPIPASIYGLILMLFALKTKLIALESVKGAADFLIEIMPVMFIPAAVELVDAWGVLEPVLLQVAVITVVSTVVVMAVSGRMTQAVIRIERKWKK